MKASTLWDAHASVYEQVFERFTVLWGHDALVLGRLPSTAGVSPRFLDVACGTGALAIAAAAKGFDVTATDFSPGMVARVDAKIASSLHANLKISTRVVDGQTLSGLDDASFDVVSSIFGAFMFPDRAVTWQSAWRVLKPGGRLLVTSWDANSPNVRISKYLLDNAANKPDAEGPDPTTMGTPNRTLAAATFREELEESGFQDVHVYTVGHPMSFHSGQEFVEGLVDNGGFKSLTANKQPVSLARCILDFAQLMLDGVDPFGDEARALVVSNAQKTAQSHPLWGQPLTVPALGHIAVATKPSA
jgi:ubiquinone/menaquinone biosynthesis C-methylase UbiE